VETTSTKKWAMFCMTCGFGYGGLDAGDHCMDVSAAWRFERRERRDVPDPTSFKDFVAQGDGCPGRVVQGTADLELLRRLVSVVPLDGAEFGLLRDQDLRGYLLAVSAALSGDVDSVKVWVFQYATAAKDFLPATHYRQINDQVWRQFIDGRPAKNDLADSACGEG
jgi:hypothetical protein